MNGAKVFLQGLSEDDIREIASVAVRQAYREDEIIFAEGDSGDCFYVVEQGCVSVFFAKAGEEVPLCTLGVGDCFGEMSLLNHDRRSASVRVLKDSTLLCVRAQEFHGLLKSAPWLGEKLKHLRTARNEELILRESLIDTTGIQGKHLYVSIKGDPSLRESAFSRERYESPVDKILQPLAEVLSRLLVSSCAYQITINFNSAEIRSRSMFDPFRECLHSAQRLLESAYVERHFQPVEFSEKIDFIRKIQQFSTSQPQFFMLPEARQNIFRKSNEQWQPLAQIDVVRLLSKLELLRNVPHFYLRQFSVSLTQDAIRMQFNCDGTHIVSADDYDTFLESNFAV